VVGVVAAVLAAVAPREGAQPVVLAPALGAGLVLRLGTQLEERRQLQVLPEQEGPAITLVQPRSHLAAAQRALNHL
jgi:hypothetical protein